MIDQTPDDGPDRYPLALRVLHWTRAVLVLGMIWAGWTMTRMADQVPAKFESFYPLHKSFGLLVFLLVLVQIAIRLGSRLPKPPVALARHEAILARLVHGAMYALLLAVPLMGYAMSATFTQSDGVTFFGIPVPEVLAKDDRWFEVFQWLHRVLAYTLLGLIVLHVGGALKHRFLDRDTSADVLPRMW